MARKRAELKQPKRSIFSKPSFIYSLILIIVIITVVIVAIIFLSQEEDTLPSNTEVVDKWLFAMDTANVQYMYNAQGIPTLALIDKEGNIVFYNSGAASKDQIMPYITQAMEGTAEILGEAPDFTVKTFNNEEFILSERRGEIVLLDIMGVGCPPCEYQMPELQKIKMELGDDITILSVDVVYSGETAQDVMNKYGEYILR